MKKQMLLALWLPLIAITVFTSCKKSGSESAEPYQIRSYNDGYQFGGMVDGQEFIPNGSSGWFGGWPAIKSRYWVPSIGGSLSNERDFFCGLFYYYGPNQSYLQNVEFNIKNFMGVGLYSLNKLTSPYGYVGRADTYGGFGIDSNNTNQKYFLTNNFGDSGYVECKRWVSDTDFEFYFNYTCKNSTVGDPDRSTKSIQGTIIRKP